MLRKENKIYQKEYNDFCANCLDCSHLVMDCTRPLTTCGICKKKHHTGYNEVSIKLILKLNENSSSDIDDDEYRFLYKRNM